MVLGIGLLLLLFSGGVAGAARAKGVLSEAQAVAALYGEAEGESYATKLATAHALRNRAAWKAATGATNLLQGVFGARSPRLRQPIDRRAWADCARAWRESAMGRDPTGGAVFWACQQDLGARYLADGEFTVKVGGHWFFKRKENKR